jgi:hypothetical protein
MKRTTFFTCSIYPDLTRVWYHFVRRYTDSSKVSFIIYDCGGYLSQDHFPGAQIIRYPNLEHGKKIDHCVRETVKTQLLFVTDDDSFILSDQAEPLVADTLLSNERAAVFSFKPREWWEFEIDGKTHPAMGSYSLAFKPEVIRRENLSFCSCPTKNIKIRKGSGYYDTADYANEQLLCRGYDVVVPEPDVRRKMVRSYSAVSRGFLNFAHRGWFSGNYNLKQSRAACAGRIRSSLQKLESGCGVAATIFLYRTFFNEKPCFDSFFTYDELMGLAGEFEDLAERDSAVKMVGGYRELLATLEAAGR